MAAGNRHSVVRGCMANGQPAAGRFLADHGAPLDEETAAAVGRIDVLQSYFDESGALRPDANRKLIESGLLYACGYGTLETATFLLDRGVNPATHNEKGETALHWASWGPETGAIQLLLGRGAPVDAKSDRFQATPLDWVLSTWDHADREENRERCYEALALLARAGAKLDRDHWRDPGSVMLGKIGSDSRMVAALRGEVGE